MSDETKSENQAWHFDGSIWEFVKVVQWALVFRQLIIEDRIMDWSEIGCNEKKLKQAAAAYGITYRNISEDMKEISQKLSIAYALIDLKRRSGIETEEPE